MKAGRLLCERGREDEGVPLLAAAFDLGRTDALSGFLLDAEPERREERLRRADAKRDGTGSHLLANHLARSLGFAHPDVEAAFSRADLHGSAYGADTLALVLNAREGNTDAVRRAAARGDRRGSVTATFNLGTFLENVGRLDEARACYQRAHERGDDHAAVALAHMEWSAGHRVKAREIVERVDAERPTWRSALLLGDLRAAAGEHPAAIEAYQRADALGEIRATIELAELWDDPDDVLATLTRAQQRLDDDTDDMWLTLSADKRAQYRARIAAIRARTRPGT